MPSPLHEALVQLFRNRPELAPELLSALQTDLPPYRDVRIDSADLTEIQPAEYRADLVVALTDATPKLGIVVEVQLSIDDRKQFAWPAYVANLRARLKCPVCLLVLAGDETVARWAARPVKIGGGNYFAPVVLRPASVPEITDVAQAQKRPELAVLSAIAHGHDPDIHKAALIARAARLASDCLDEDRSLLYLDLIMISLSEPARGELDIMKPAGYEFQSDWARHHIARGQAMGRAALIVRLLTRRFGALPPQVEARIADASIAQLDEIGERLLSAQTLDEALGAG
jgi:hypothetical protein